MKDPRKAKNILKEKANLFQKLFGGKIRPHIEDTERWKKWTLEMFGKPTSEKHFRPVLVHSTSWKFSTLCKFSLHIVYINKKGWVFLTKFWCFDQMFRRNVFTLLCFKSQTSAHAQLAITLLYILLANILIWYQLEIYMKDTPC